MKRFLALLLTMLCLTLPVRAVDVLPADAISVAAPSACLMERSTGTVLYEKDAHTPRPIASVTKVMTLLLVLEAVDRGEIALTDTVTASSHAADMGGSQIWLEEGEQMTVDEMLKCVTVVSANDCATALAEFVAGTEESFVQKMNERAAALGMTDTHFVDCTGLTDDPNHHACAYDVAVMSRELLSHDQIRTYSTIWMDTARDGAFGLTNTNKLIRFYEGATGLKTGYTSAAKYCLAASALRSDTEYVAAVLGADSSADRFESAKTLLNYAFANYVLRPMRMESPLPPIPVTLGTADCVQPVYPDLPGTVLTKQQAGDLQFDLQLPDRLEAPIAAGESIGTLTVSSGGQTLAEIPLLADREIPRLNTGEIFGKLVEILFCAP